MRGCEVCLHLWQIRSESQRLLVGGNRLFKLPQFLISKPKVIECLNVVRLDFQRGSVCVYCLRCLRCSVGSQPEVNECRHIARQEF